MRARTRANVALLVLALVLGLTILLLPQPGPEHPPPAIEFDPNALQSLTLEPLDRSRSIRLERRAGEWFMVTPAERGMDSGRVARALAALRAPTSSCYPAAEPGMDEFGLDPPQAKMTLDSTIVEFGYRTPDGRRYVRSQGRLCLVEDLTLPIFAAQVTSSEPDG